MLYDRGNIEGRVPAGARWGTGVGKARLERSAETGPTADERAELVLLRGENAQLRMERRLLKRSLALWLNESTL